ncbi:MAG: DNA modification methylase [bacterium]
MSKQKDPAVVRDLKPSPNNPRSISERRAAQLAKTMAAFGDLSSITMNRRSGHLVSGHQRVKHLQPNAKIETKPHADDVGTVAVGRILSGKNAWPYRVVDWDEKTEAAAMVAANAAGGAFQEDALLRLVKGLDVKGFDLDLLGLEDVEAILATPEGGAADDVGSPTAGGKATAKRGDVWILGEHRLMCGDSTSAADVHRLMGHDRAQMCFTDPPYGVSYQGDNHDVIMGDRKRDDALYELVAGALKQAVAFSDDTAAFYVWHASSTRREFEDALRAAGLSERQYILWVKNALVLGRADYQWSHEPCFYAAKTGHAPKWHGDRAQPTVWRASLRKRTGVATTLGTGLVVTDGRSGTLALTPSLAKGKKARSVRLDAGQTLHVEVGMPEADVWEVARENGADYVHPTQKPVELAAIALRNSTKPGEIVLDLFGGSGSTLMAAEASGRRARLMELDPKYVDAIVHRWQTATERTATREE